MENLFVKVDFTGSAEENEVRRESELFFTIFKLLYAYFQEVTGNVCILFVLLKVNFT